MSYRCLAAHLQGGIMYPEPVNITSLQNDRVKEIVRLRERRARDASDQFLIEGYREIRRALDAHYPIQSLYYCAELFLGENEHFLIAEALRRKAEIYQCSAAVFNKISYRDRPDGLIAVAPQKHLHLDALDAILSTRPTPFLVVAEAIEKPGNLGTILRSSDAVGADGLIVCDRCTDIHNPNVVRASVGTLFTVPVVEAEGAACLAWLKERKIKIVATTPQATSEFTDIDLTIPIAICVGTEQLGLSNPWLEEAHYQVKIPMHGVADSLNVAMATTLMLYEVHRQRRLKNGSGSALPRQPSIGGQ